MGWFPPLPPLPPFPSACRSLARLLPAPQPLCTPSSALAWHGAHQPPTGGSSGGGGGGGSASSLTAKAGLLGSPCCSLTYSHSELTLPQPALRSCQAFPNLLQSRLPPLSLLCLPLPLPATSEPSEIKRGYACVCVCVDPREWAQGTV